MSMEDYENALGTQRATSKRNKAVDRKLEALFDRLTTLENHQLMAPERGPGGTCSTCDAPYFCHYNYCPQCGRNFDE